MAKFDVILEACAWFTTIVVVAGGVLFHTLDLRFGSFTAFSNHSVQEFDIDRRAAVAIDEADAPGEIPRD